MIYFWRFFNSGSKTSGKMLSFIKLFLLQNFIIVFVSIILALYYLEITHKISEKFGFSQEPITENSVSYLVDETTEGVLSNSIEDNTYDDNLEKLYTKQQLAEFDGERSSKIYLSILGSVYDVSKGARFYGKDGTYHVFAGRDASVSFITGDFVNVTESDHVLRLKPSDVLSLYNWKSTYDKSYVYKGKLIGRFYDETGAKTDYHLEVERVLERAKLNVEKEKQFDSMYPGCNIEWKKESGTRVWCSTLSGGKKRNWVGYPRKYFEPGQTSFRCVCVEDFKANSKQLKYYDDCDPKSEECYYSVD